MMDFLPKINFNRFLSGFKYSRKWGGGGGGGGPWLSFKVSYVRYNKPRYIII